MNDDNFLRSGKYDDMFTVLNSVNFNSSDIIPINTSRLTEHDIKTVISRLPQYPYIVAKWQSVVGANGRRIVVADSDNLSDSTRARKKAVQRATYSLLYSKLKVRNVQREVVSKIASEGCAIVRFTSEMKPVVDSKFRYNWYWNEAEKKLRLAYVDPITGQEVKEMTNLKHGEELYIIKHPSYEDWIMPLSPVETILLIAKLEFHATVANQKLFDHGMVGQIFLKMQKEMLPELQKAQKEDTDDKPSWFTQLIRQMNDKLSGSKKSNQVSFMPGLEDILEVGKDNKSMQFFELLKDLTPERIAWNWLLTSVDFGAGGSTTYNNATVFDDSLFDKFGQHLEHSLDEMTNEWLLPALNIRTTESYYVEYIPPEDPKKLEQLREAREDVKARLMTPNEYREMKGLTPLDGGDVLLESVQQPQFNVIDADIVQPKRLETGFFSKALNYRATNVDKALASDEYTGKKGFLNNLKKAIEKQIKDYTETLEGLEEVPETVNIKPLETFYSFPAIKKDLLKFAGIALESVKKDKRTSFSYKKFEFDGEYPQGVIDFIDEAVQRLLKGDKEFKSVDVETASQIETLIRDNISDGVFALAQKILEEVESISLNRASLIAQTEVANAVEGTREIMYTTDPLFKDGYKSWLTSADERVRVKHKNNEEQGKIAIDALFSNGFSRAGSEPRCRCDILYYTSSES